MLNCLEQDLKTHLNEFSFSHSVGNLVVSSLEIWSNESCDITSCDIMSCDNKDLEQHDSHAYIAGGQSY